jgi:hypothetical protein
MSFETISLVPGNPATLIVEKGRPATVFNTDASHSVVMGNSNAIQAGDYDTTLIGPGQFFTFDGKDNIYGMTPLGTTPVILTRVTGLINAGNSTATVSNNLVSVQLDSPGEETVLIGPSGIFPNPENLPVRLISLFISSGLVAGTGASGPFVIQDYVYGNGNGITYHELQIGLSANDTSQMASKFIRFDNIVVPGDVNLTFVNGGNSGFTTVSHICFAMAEFYLVSEPS